MAWSTPKGFNFRNTSAFVTDGTNETFVLPTDAYPTTRTVGGESVTFGWETVVTANGRDRSAAAPYAPELSGVTFLGPSDTPTSLVFRVDLPATGSYAINIAAGDQAGASKAFFEVDDTSTSVLAFGPTVVAGGSFMDAAGTARTGSDWQANNVPATETFATTIFRLKVNKATVNESPISHLTLTESGAGVVPTVSSVNGGAAVVEGATNVAVVGTGFLSGMTSKLLQPGGVSVAQPFTFTDATDGTFNLSMEPAGTQLAFTDATYVTTYTVTTAGGTSSPVAVTLAPPAGLIFQTLASINPSSSTRITALPDLAIGDQLEAAGNAAGTAPIPTGLSLNSDATFQFSIGNTPQPFYVRAYDGVNFVWGAWALQSLPPSGTAQGNTGRRRCSVRTIANL